MIDQIHKTAAAAGIDLPALLGTTVDVNVQRPDGSTDVIRIGALRLIEIFNVPDGPATGVNILGAPLSVGAGFIIHGGASFTPTNLGYTVTEASALPAVPALPQPLSTLVPPGKIKHVVSHFPADVLVSQHSVAVGAGTESDAVSGLPVSLAPISTAGSVPGKGIDFVGSATIIPPTNVFGALGDRHDGHRRRNLRKESGCRSTSAACRSSGATRSGSARRRLRSTELWRASPTAC